MKHHKSKRPRQREGSPLLPPPPKHVCDALRRREESLAKRREPHGCRALIPVDERYDADPSTPNWVYCQAKKHLGESYCDDHASIYFHDIQKWRAERDARRGHAFLPN